MADNSEAKPVDNFHNKFLKKIVELISKTFESNKERK